MAKTSTDKKAKILSFLSKTAGNLDTAVVLIFLSNLNESFKNILASQRDAFQCTTFILNIIGWLISTAKLATATNKNIGKVQSWLVATAKVIIAGLILFGAALAPVATTALFFTLISIDTVIAAGKAIYFAVKAQLAKSPELKQFFQKKAKKNAVTTAIGILVIAIFVITVVAAPYIGLPVLGAVGITGAVIMGIITLAGIGKAIYQTFFKNKFNEPNEENSLKSSELVSEQKADLTETSNSLLDLPNEFTPSALVELETNSTKLETELTAKPNTNPATSSEETGYFAYSGTATNLADDIKKAINEHIKKIQQDETEDKTNQSFWSQTEKRESKVLALCFLKAVLYATEHEDIPEKGSIYIDDQLFTYHNKEELIEKINFYVTETYPGAYQSFFKAVGKVEDLFNQTYQLLRDKNQVSEKNVSANAETNQHENLTAEMQKKIV